MGLVYCARCKKYIEEADICSHSCDKVLEKPKDNFNWNEEEEEE